MKLDRLKDLPGEGASLCLVPEIEGVLRLAEAEVSPVLGLFDGSLSSLQEEAVRGAFSLYETRPRR